MVCDFRKMQALSKRIKTYDEMMGGILGVLGKMPTVQTLNIDAGKLTPDAVSDQIQGRTEAIIKPPSKNPKGSDSLPHARNQALKRAIAEELDPILERIHDAPRLLDRTLVTDLRSFRQPPSRCLSRKMLLSRTLLCFCVSPWTHLRRKCVFCEIDVHCACRESTIF